MNLAIWHNLCNVSFVSYTADASDKSKAKTDDKKQTDKGKKPAEKSTGKSTTTKTPAKSSSKPTPKQQKTGQLCLASVYVNVDCFCEVPQ